MAPPHNWNARIRTVREKGMTAISAGVIERWFTPTFQKQQPDAVAKITAMLLNTSEAGYIASCSAIRDMDQREAIRQASRPTLVIIGDQDPATPPHLGLELAHAIKGARTKILKGAHLSNVEAAKAFTKAVLSFLMQPPDVKTSIKKTIKKSAKTAAKTAAKKTITKTVKTKTIAKKAAKKMLKKTTPKKTKTKVPARKGKR
jgi:hypothetical protein